LATNSAALHAETVAEQATPAALAAVHAALDRAWLVLDAASPAPPATGWRDLFRTAVAEIAANVVRHAYPPSRAARPFELQVLLYDDRIEALFLDHGVAWDPAEEPVAPDPLDLPEGGLGLAVARGALDELSYRRERDGRNVWRLVKRYLADP
jgi:serine/threonine-protein kinase RsbW